MNTIRTFARRLRRYVSDLRRGLRCGHCGRRARWGESWHGYGSPDRVWHDVCMSYRHWRTKADERLQILDLVTDVWQVRAQDVYSLAEGRAADGDPDQPSPRTSAESDAWNLAWRVFYDLEHHRTAQGAPTR